MNPVKSLAAATAEALAAWIAAACLAGLVAAPSPAHAGAVMDRVVARQEVRVCIWPEYYSVTYRHRHSGELSGIDIDMSAALAKDLKVQLRYVDSSFATLLDDIENDRCDVAMFAIGILPQRMARLRFTRPYLHSDIYAITTRGNRSIREWSDIDQPGVVVAVATGTFMEPVMAGLLKRASLLSVRAPQTREAELRAGRADVFMTDFPYSRRLLDEADWAVLIQPPAPVYNLPYAYAVKPGDDQWLNAVDEFVGRARRDGRLEAAARRHGLLPILVK